MAKEKFDQICELVKKVSIESFNLKTGVSELFHGLMYYQVIGEGLEIRRKFGNLDKQREENYELICQKMKRILEKYPLVKMGNNVLDDSEENFYAGMSCGLRIPSGDTIVIMTSLPTAENYYILIVVLNHLGLISNDSIQEYVHHEKNNLSFYMEKLGEVIKC